MYKRQMYIDLSWESVLYDITWYHRLVHMYVLPNTVTGAIVPQTVLIKQTGNSMPSSLLQTFVGQADFKTLYMSKVNYKLCLVSDLVVLYPIFNIVLIIIIIT